jgi:hypothetical protein
MNQTERDTRFWILMSFMVLAFLVYGAFTNMAHRIDRIDHVAPSGHFACWLEANPAMPDGMNKVCGDPVRRKNFIQWTQLPEGNK